jgi:hypothetical protein
MTDQQIRLPMTSIQEITRLFVPEDVVIGSVIQLAISFDSNDITIRQLSSYLSLIDGFYGRFYPEGIHAYAHRLAEQLKISEIRSGSMVTIVTDILSSGEVPYRLVLLYLLLKYLPQIIKSSAEAVKNLASGYRDYQEASKIREERENRRRLRQAIREDAELQGLKPQHQQQLVKLLDFLYAMESNRLPQAIQIAKGKIKHLKLTIRRNK